MKCLDRQPGLQGAVILAPALTLILSALANAAGPDPTGITGSPGRAMTVSLKSSRSSGGRFDLGPAAPGDGIQRAGAGRFEISGSIRALAESAVIFEDDFSSGNRCNWTLSVPADTSCFIPSGGVAFFESLTCPAGWSPLDSNRGRAVVGLPAGGTLAGTRGASLGDLQSVGHDHSGSFSVTTGNSGVHNHFWSIFTLGRVWRSRAINGTNVRVFDWSTIVGGIGAPGGVYPLVSESQLAHYTDERGVHGHSFSDSDLSSAVAINRPYFQLLACEKD